MNSAIQLRYEAMTDSGVEWLGQIPANWHTRKLKFVVKILKRIAGHEGPSVLSITQQGIKIKDIESGEGQLAQNYSGYQLVDRGDFAMNHMDLLTGYVDISNFDGVVSPDYRVFRNFSDEVLDEYLLLIFQIGFRQKIFFRYGQGVSLLGRWRLPADSFNDFKIPIPPVAQQRKIVDFLNAKVPAVEEAVRIKEQQIALLRERRQILIQQAVTRGLNPDAPMKDSGFDWIGQIPAHWAVKRLRHAAPISPSKRVDGNTNRYDRVVFLPMEAVGADGHIQQSQIRPAKDISEGFTYFRRGDVIMAKITPCFENGKSAHLIDLSSGYGFGTTELHVLRPKDVSGKFLYYYINRSFFRKIGEAFMVGSAGQKRVSTEYMKDQTITVPPLKEQLEIIEVLDREGAKIETAISIKKSQIDALKEYKTSLINAAVTGKIKVT